MNRPNDNHHPSAERLQAFLEEDLPKRERHLVEEHLGMCARCAAELEGWKVLFTDLKELRGLRPHEGFTDRVMMQVEIPEARTISDRLRDGIAALLGLGQTGHLDTSVAQDLVEGLVPARQAARVRRHLDQCGACSHEVEGFERILRRLDTLPSFAPSETFADRVMVRVQIAPSTVARPERAASGWMVAARKLVPSTRRAWAALSGAAVTPVVTLGLVAYAVFSHPALTLGSLLSWMSWQIADLASVGWSASLGAFAQGVSALGLQDLLNAAAAAPLAIAGISVVYSVLVLLALRVLYKNLFAVHPLDIAHAQISRS